MRERTRVAEMKLQHTMTGPRYERRHDHIVCLDCGAIIAETAAHSRFHSVLNGHAWMLAVLKTAHIGAGVHDRYDVDERTARRQFDSWTNDALADLIRARTDTP
jgi:hypothetical protein